MRIKVKLLNSHASIEYLQFLEASSFTEAMSKAEKELTEQGWSGLAPDECFVLEILEN